MFLVRPQPGLLPFIYGIVLTILALILFIKTWLGHAGGNGTFGQLWRPIVFILALFIYVAISKFAGYIIAATILSAMVLRIMDTQKWWKILLISFIVALGSYFLFDRLLDLRLPVGILGRLG